MFNYDDDDDDDDDDDADDMFDVCKHMHTRNDVSQELVSHFVWQLAKLDHGGLTIQVRSSILVAKRGS